MKNIILITEDGEQLISSTDDGTNQLIINDTVIPSVDWVGTGTYTDTIHGHSISIDKAPDLDGIIQLVKLSTYNYALKKAKTQQGLYPVGSCYTTSVNTDPSSYLGGSWVLTDKVFRIADSGDGFTFNNTNTTNGTFRFFRSGHHVMFRISFNNKVVFNDNNFDIGSFNMSVLGFNNTNLYYNYFTGFSDAGNAIGMFTLTGDATPVLRIGDVVVNGSGSTVAAGNTWYLQDTLFVPPNKMLDEACDCFIWTRVN